MEKIKDRYLKDVAKFKVDFKEKYKGKYVEDLSNTERDEILNYLIQRCIGI